MDRFDAPRHILVGERRTWRETISDRYPEALMIYLFTHSEVEELITKELIPTRSSLHRNPFAPRVKP